MDTDERVRDAIRRSGKTHADIARESGLSQSAVNRIANGRRSAQLDTLNRMKRAVPAIGDIVAAEFQRAS